MNKQKQKIVQSPRVCPQSRSIFSTLKKERIHDQTWSNWLNYQTGKKSSLMCANQTKLLMYSQKNDSIQNKVCPILKVFPHSELRHWKTDTGGGRETENCEKKKLHFVEIWKHTLSTTSFSQFSFLLPSPITTLGLTTYLHTSSHGLDKMRTAHSYSVSSSSTQLMREIMENIRWNKVKNFCFWQLKTINNADYSGLAPNVTSSKLFERLPHKTLYFMNVS